MDREDFIEITPPLEEREAWATFRQRMTQRGIDGDTVDREKILVDLIRSTTAPGCLVRISVHRGVLSVDAEDDSKKE